MWLTGDVAVVLDYRSNKTGDRVNAVYCLPAPCIIKQYAVLQFIPLAAECFENNLSLKLDFNLTAARRHAFYSLSCIIIIIMIVYRYARV